MKMLQKGGQSSIVRIAGGWSSRKEAYSEVYEMLKAVFEKAGAFQFTVGRDTKVELEDGDRLVLFLNSRRDNDKQPLVILNVDTTDRKQWKKENPDYKPKADSEPVAETPPEESTDEE